MFLCTIRPLTLSINTIEGTMGPTLSTKYEQMGRVSGQDHPRREQFYSFPYSVGVVHDVVVSEHERERTYGVRQEQRHGGPKRKMYLAM